MIGNDSVVDSASKFVVRSGITVYKLDPKQFYRKLSSKDDLCRYLPVPLRYRACQGVEHCDLLRLILSTEY